MALLDARSRVLAGIAFLVCAGAGCGPGRFNGAPFDPPRPAPEIAGAAADGTPFRLSALRGRVAVLAFGYTSCPDVCPTTLSTLKTLYRRLGEDAERVSMIFVSIDPDRDTAERLQAYVSAFDARIVGLRPEGAARASLLASYGVEVSARPVPRMGDAAGASAGEGAAYLLDHPAGLFVVDRGGRLRLRVPADAPVEETLSDVARLAREEDRP